MPLIDRLAWIGANKRPIIDVSLFLASTALMVYTVKWVLDGELPGLTTRKRIRNKQLSERLRRLGTLDEYEESVANEIILPDEIDVSFSDIGGLDAIVSSLRESVIFPLLYPDLFTSQSTDPQSTHNSLLSAPKGVLLYGPPGCGKTMIAKALAKESGATFINVTTSVMSSKWFGDSNKLVKGLFSLARKCQPTIIFVDEIDGFLRKRMSTDHEASSSTKAEFMSLWDGLLSSTDRILVLGATNRPTDIDSAILRRMPKQFPVSLPTAEQRYKILSLLLKHTRLESDFDTKALAEMTDGLSGSDLKELCRNAAMLPVREYLREFGDTKEVLEKGQFKLRPLRFGDFLARDPAALSASLSTSMNGMMAGGEVDPDSFHDPL